MTSRLETEWDYSANKIAFKNGRISNFEKLLTLTLDRVILHKVVHDSSTSTYMQNLIEIKETFCGGTYLLRTYIHMDGQTDGQMNISDQLY